MSTSVVLMPLLKRKFYPFRRSCLSMISVSLEVKMELKSLRIVSSKVIGRSLSSFPPHSEVLGMSVIMLCSRSVGSVLVEIKELMQSSR